MQVPREVSVIGMDSMIFGEMISPSLTSIVYPFREMSEKAVDLIIGWSMETTSVNSTITVEPGIIIRESTAECCTSR